MSKEVKSKKMYMVEFNTPPFGEGGDTIFYFSSVAAIYNVFTPSQIGCAKHRLWDLGAAKGETVQCKHCTVKTLTLFANKGKSQ